MDQLLCITGPTASGKTELAIALARALAGELISVDSALVYRGLDIGSAKPDFPHHLVDLCEPQEVYSAARFVEDANAAMALVQSRGRRPILVGGTMLYLKALLEGMDPLPAADPALRARLTERAECDGWPVLHAELARLDPDAADAIHPNHSQRLLRALELVMLSGKPLSELHSRQQGTSPSPANPGVAPALTFALVPADRKQLHQRIEQRFDAMMEAGFLAEVKQLRNQPGLSEALPAIRAVGYRQLWRHLEGVYDLNTAREKALAATRQLAKRQLTWLRKWPGLIWLETDELGEVVRYGPARQLSECKEKLTPEKVVLSYLDA